MQKLKVGIAINNLLVREGVLALLTKQKHIKIAYIAESAKSLKKIQKDSLDDLLIIDFYSNDFNKELVFELCGLRKNKPVMALTSYAVGAEAKWLRENGLMGYLLHDCSEDEIFEAFQYLISGEQFYCGKVIDAILQQVAKPEEFHEPTANCEGLNISERELEIINCIAEGLSSKEIANKLCISPLTVKTHRKNIMSKLGVNNAAGIVRFAMGEI